MKLNKTSVITLLWLAIPLLLLFGDYTYRQLIPPSPDPPEGGIRPPSPTIPPTAQILVGLYVTPTAPPPKPTHVFDLKRMVFVPAGEFIMGTNDTEDREDRADEKPEHVVYLDAFYIDKYELTVAEYINFLNAFNDIRWGCSSYDCLEAHNLFRSGSLNIHTANGKYQASPGSEDLPIMSVRWQAAYAYCRWTGKRLPTEAEWEKAARGMDGRKYPWGNLWSLDYFIGSRAIRSGKYSLRVGLHPDDISPYGAFDMLGNANEWVNDWYAEDYYAHSPDTNPQGPETGTQHIHRGAYGRGPVLGLTVRNTDPDQYVGFRCAYSPHEAPE